MILNGRDVVEYETKGAAVPYFLPGRKYTCNHRKTVAVRDNTTAFEDFIPQQPKKADPFEKTPPSKTYYHSTRRKTIRSR